MKQFTIRMVIIVLMGVLLCIFIALLSFEFDRGMKKMLAQYERDYTYQHARGASILVRSSLRPLVDAARDWSRWDATYSFISDRNQSFLTDELNDDFFSLYRLNFAIILDEKYQMVYQRFFDFAAAKDLDPDPDLQLLLKNFMAMLVQDKGTGRETDLMNSSSNNASGFIRYKDTWVYLSAFAVIPSTGKGEPNGILLMGRIIDERELHRIERTIESFSIQRLLHAETERLFSLEVFKESPFFLDYSREGRITVFHKIDAVYGDDLVIFIDEERTIYTQGIAMIRSLTIFIIVTALVMLVLLLFLLEKLLLRPLKELSAYVGHIDDVAELSAPPLHWGREFTSFVNALHTMFARVAEKQRVIEQQNTDMRHTLTHDSLTGLPNIFQCECTFEEARATQPDSCSGVHLFYIRLTNLKLINSTLGFPLGDAVLVQFAKRLRHCCPDALTVACIDGHHFGVLYSGDTVRIEDVSAKCRALSGMLEAPVDLDDCQVRLAVSIGVASYPTDSANVQELRRNATIAANAVLLNKDVKYMIFDDSLLRHVADRLHMEEALLKALENDEFIPFFQPKLDLKTKRITGVEALVRWASADTIIPPGKFIPVADETGLIIQITWLMMEKACRENQRFAAAGFDVAVSVNVPVQAILHTDFVQRTLVILEKTGMPSHRLEIEITEETLIADVEKTRDVVDALHRHDIKVSVDDFGTGYSSLQYLKKVPFSTIKIDKSFVDGIPGSEYDEAIIKASVEIAQALGLKVIVEGVETIEQWAAVKAMGCDELQGYVVSKPVCSDAFIDLLRQWNGSGPPAADLP